MLESGERMPGARWFPQARINYAENLLRRRDDADALVFWGEAQLRRRLSYRQLNAEVSRCAQALTAAGVGKGDRVAAYGRNSDAYVLLWLGCVKAGLIHVPINYALLDAELRYIVEQSGARALFCDADMATHVEALGSDLPCEWRGTLHGGHERDVLEWAQAGGTRTIRSNHSVAVIR